MGKSLSFSARVIGLMMSIYIIMSGLPGPVVAMADQPARVAHHASLSGSLMNVAGATAMATVVDSALGAYLAFGLLVGGGVCTGGALPCRPRCRAGSCAAGPWRCRSCTRRAPSAAAFAAKLLELLILRTGDWRDALVGDRRLFGAGRGARAGLRAREARRHGPGRRRRDRGRHGCRGPAPAKPQAHLHHGDAVGIPRCRAQPHLLADPVLRWWAAAACTRCFSRTASWCSRISVTPRASVAPRCSP